MELPLSDETLAIIVPILVYWVYSGIYIVLGYADSYRLHTKEEEHTKNSVSKREVARVVLLQQLVQAFVAFFVIKKRNDSNATGLGPTPLAAVAAQFLVGMFVMDTWQYFWHRYMHANKFLFRHVHCWHHRLHVNYAFGGQYNHPMEGLLFNTVGGAVAFVASGMSPRTSIFFFSLSTMRGIDLHCGLRLHWRVLDWLLLNSSVVHDLHHRPHGTRYYNFSQPCFVVWDKIMGTYLPPAAAAARETNERDD